jgi:hypothetical protein
MSKPCCQRNPSPFKGEVGRGMGAKGRISSLPDYPIPTPSLPLKGRERVPRSGMCIAGNHLRSVLGNVTSLVIPEPPSLMLFGIAGLSLFGGFWRRRRTEVKATGGA